MKMINTNITTGKKVISIKSPIITNCIIKVKVQKLRKSYTNRVIRITTKIDVNMTF